MKYSLTYEDNDDWMFNFTIDKQGTWMQVVLFTAMFRISKLGKCLTEQMELKRNDVLLWFGRYSSTILVSPFFP